MITPLEIRQHQFKKGFNGYNKDDVQNFLNTVAAEWERMQEDLKRSKQDYEKAQKDLDGLRQVESALHRTLLQAEETSKATIEGAKKDAEAKIANAEAHANEIVTKALSERNRIEKQINDLVDRRTEILAQLRNYLTAQNDRLKSFEEKEMKRFEAPSRPADPVPVNSGKEKPKAEEKAAPPVKETPNADSPKEEQAKAEEKTPAVESKAEAPKTENTVEEAKADTPAKEDPSSKEEGAKPEGDQSEAKAETPAPESKESEDASAKEAAKEGQAAKESESQDHDPKRPIITVRPVNPPKEEAKPVGNSEKKSFFDRNVGNDSGDEGMIDDLLDDL